MSMDITWLYLGKEEGVVGGLEVCRGGGIPWGFGLVAVVALRALLGHCTLLSVADRWNYRITGLGIWSAC